LHDDLPNVGDGRQVNSRDAFAAPRFDDYLAAVLGFVSRGLMF
jgi:hypothetical protein